MPILQQWASRCGDLEIAGRFVAKMCSIHSNAQESGALVSEAKALFDACSFCSNGIAGVVTQQRGSITLKQCKIHDNGTDGVMIQDSGSARIEQCDVYSNSANGIFVGFDHRGSASIIQSAVHDNRSKGILIGNRSKGLKLCENKEYNNHGLVPHMPRTVLQNLSGTNFKKFTKRMKKNKESNVQGLQDTQTNSFLDVLVRDCAKEVTEKAIQGLEKLTQECAFCQKMPAGEKDFQTCGRCRIVRYCSSSCQKSHWTQHKPNCQPKPAKYPAFVDHQQSV